MAAGLALTAAALAASGLAASGPGTTDRAAAGPAASGRGGGAGPAAGTGAAEEAARAVHLVSAPVRIADAATVRLLRPGDRVDVIVADDADSDARVVAKGVRVAAVPRGPAEDGPGSAHLAGGPDPSAGALVVLSVERETATALAGAGVSGRLAVAVTHGH